MIIFQLWVELRQQIRAVNKRIVVLVKDDENGKLLTPVPWAGYYDTLLIRVELGVVNRSPSAKQLGYYGRLFLSTYPSRNASFYAHITKQGSKW